MPHPLIEICVEGLDGLLAAQAGGADRAELCAALIEGGITPSIGTVRAALARATIPFRVIIRPRGGDFLYSETEFATMTEDVAAMRELGVAGVVVGCLTAEGEIDTTRMRALVEAAGPLGVTCHRAFDMTRDPAAALEALIACGVDRVLTSGQRDSAAEGVETLRALVAQAAGRITVMGCGKLDATNIAAIRDATGLTEMHFSAPSDEPSGMVWRNPHVGMGGTALDREYTNTVTDPARIRATIAAVRAEAEANAEHAQK
jgi:copper homeostasis protein